MNKYFNLIFIGAVITCLIPCAGKFAVGLVLCAGIVFITIFGTLLNCLFKHILNDNLSSICSFIAIILLCMLFKQLVAWASPIMSLYINFTIYLASLSSMMLSYFFDKQSNAPTKPSVKTKLLSNTAITLRFCFFALVFFFFRDWIGYDVISFPGRTKIMQVSLPSIHICKDTFFWGSIPFALFLLAVLICVHTVILKKSSSAKRNREK